jgi:uncharacterized membrane protein
VNDTFTGVACADWVGDALLVVGDVPEHDGVWVDAAGRPRLHVRPVRLERLVRLAFDQLRQASADNPAVLIRMLETIRRIAPRLEGPGVRAALKAEADAIREVALAKVAARLDQRDVEAAWEHAASVLDEPEADSRQQPVVANAS